MSFFSGAQDALEEALLEREKQKRQAMLDALNQRKAEAEMQDRALARQLQAAQLQQAEALRRAQADAANEAMAQKVAETLGPNTQLDSDTSDVLRNGGLGALIQRQQVALPSTSITGVAEATQGAPNLTNVTKTANDGMGDVFRGTAKQLKEQQDRQAKLDYIKSLPADSTARKVLEAQVATGDNSISEKLFEDDNPQQPVYRINPRTGAVEQIGSAPKGAHFVNEPAPPKVSVNVGAGGADYKPTASDEQIATKLATGELSYSQWRALTGRGDQNSAQRQSQLLRASEINPNFNPAQFQLGYSFATSPKVRQQIAALNNVEVRVPDLLRVSEQAKRTGVPAINKVMMPMGVYMGGKHYSDFKTARIAFADELSGALGFGSATDMSRAMGFDMTDSTLSPEQFSSAITNIVVPFIRDKKATMLGQMGPYGKDGYQPEPKPADGGSPAQGSVEEWVRDPKTGKLVRKQ